MGFLDSVAIPNQPKPAATPATPAAGGFLASVQAPANQGEATKIANLKQSAATAQTAATDAGSFSGMFKNAIINPIKSYFSDSLDQAKQFAQNPDKTIWNLPSTLFQSVADSASQGFDQGVSAVNAIHDDYKNGTGSTAGDVANLAKLAAAVPSILFAPVSGAFATAEKVPVLKQIADTLSIPFTATGVAATYGTGKIFDIIPDSLLSEKSKDILRKPISDLASLAAQVTIGGKIMAKVADVVKTGNPVTVPEATRIVQEVQAEHTPVFAPDHEQVPAPVGETVSPPSPVPVETASAPVEKPADTQPTYYHSTSADSAESIKKNGFTAQIGERSLGVANAEGTWLYEDKSAATEFGKNFTRVGKTPAVVEAKINGKIFDATNDDRSIRAIVEDKPFISKLKSEGYVAVKGDELGTPATFVFDKDAAKPVGTGETQTSGLAQSVNKDAIKTGLKEGLGALPEYSRMDMKEQAQLAADFIKKDPDQALRVALGEENSPIPHLLPESVYTAMRITARDAGDVETLRKLAQNSSIVSNATALGQRIKALDSGVREDAVSIIQDVKEKRESNIEGKKKGTIQKTKAALADDIKAEIAKEVSKRPTWEEFIKEVQCQY